MPKDVNFFAGQMVWAILLNSASVAAQCDLLQEQLTEKDAEIAALKQTIETMKGGA